MWPPSPGRDVSREAPALFLFTILRNLFLLSSSLSSPRNISPEQLVHLEVQPQLPLRVTHPLGDLGRDRARRPLEDRRNENRVLLVELVCLDESDRPVEVFAVLDDELDLVSR